MKILDVIDRFLARPELITDVVLSETEYYFRYRRHPFSIVKRHGDAAKEMGEYSLFIYPRWTGDMKRLAELYELGEGEDIPIAPFPSKDLKPENVKKFAALYQLLKDKFMNVDAIIDDILKDPPF